MTTSSDGEFGGTDRFEVVRRLGAGGMGVVYQAYDRERARTVALKTLRHRDAAALYRFKREFRGLADISHPNLAALHELVSAGDEWFFTMELVEGVDFITWVRGDEARTQMLDIDDLSPIGDELSPAYGDDFPTRSSNGSLAGSATELWRGPVADPSPPRSYDRLRDAMRQLAEGVQVLHQAGKLHRDIKPSNVMVDRSGRVVLLDFGLITDVARPGGGASDDYSVVGTVDYMSPEQGASLPLGPASDWYSVGTVLYRALTGTLPFFGPPIVVLMEKQRSEPEPPIDLLPETPEDLSQLACELLRCDPVGRPDGNEILRRLGSRAAAPVAARRRPTGSRSQDTPLVGRSAHAAVLRDAFATATREGKAVTVLVHGRSGMGKSMLIGRVTRELARERSAVVLAGRCYERESVPYKALDSLIDSLSRHLAQLPRHEVDALMPRDVLAVARLFPVLRRVDSVKSAPRRIVAPDPHELRRRGLAALRELLARMADRRPLILMIDDLQWGDLDSTMLVLDLLRPPDAPALTLVLAYRSEEAATSDAVRHLLGGLRAAGPAGDVREMEVGALAPEEARELALARLQREGESGEKLAEEIARESAGDPFVIDQLVRFLHAAAEPGTEVSFAEVMRARLAHIGPDARRVLELVAVAAHPLPQQVVARAAGLMLEEQVMAVLRAGSLIRTSGAPELGRIETYHDRIREVVVAALSEPQQRECHLALADALESSERPDPEALAVHLLNGGAIERGTEYAIEAAAKASAALAFERAAVFLRLAIEALPPDEVTRRRLRAALGDALVNAGRGVDAATEYLSALEGIPAAEALELRRRAGEQLLRCGRVDSGLRALETVLDAVGMKLAPTPRRAIWSFLRRRMRARLRGLRFVERDPTQVSAEHLTRVDICWSVAVGVGLTDPIRGLDFQTRHLLLALAAGEPYRISRALAVEAGFSSLGGRATGKRTQRLIGLASEIANRIDQPHARGLVAIARGMADYQTGRWGAALGGFEDAASILRGHCTGVAFEISSALRYAVDTLFNLGSLGEMCRRVPQYLAEAERRGDLYGATDMRTGLPSAAWLVADDPDTARAECERGRRSFSQLLGFCLQHYYELLAHTHIDLYVGDGEAAYQRIEERWPKLVKSRLLRIQVVRAEALFLRGRAALAAAAATSPGSERRGKLLAEAHRAQKLLDGQPLPAAHAQANVLAAGAARLRGDTEQAIQLLAQAESRFQTAEMELAAAATRHRRGDLTGGPTGERLVADAARWMRAETIRNPAAMTRLIC
ncbi:MAG TPA: protein kinase [Kofleriaceae bacterium]|nr:protein kinase [Kofleriaceae bacterium]